MEGFWQRPSAQVVPPLQTLLAQQGWSSIPQGGARHVPIVQTSSRSQLSPRQQAVPSAPQRTHVPARQTPPESHTSPQHEAPIPPQGGGASGGAVTSMPGVSMPEAIGHESGGLGLALQQPGKPGLRAEEAGRVLDQLAQQGQWVERPVDGGIHDEQVAERARPARHAFHEHRPLERDGHLQRQSLRERDIVLREATRAAAVVKLDHAADA